jgi:hypothetical protein
MFFFTQAVEQQSTSFWSQGILGVNGDLDNYLLVPNTLL